VRRSAVDDAYQPLGTIATALADSMASQDDDRLSDSITELRAVVKLEKQI
jgi:hypothetical protein